MSETDRNTDTNPDGKGGAADAELNKLKSQIDELTKNLNDSRAEVKTLVTDRQTLKEELRELKSSKRKESDDKAADEKDIEKLRTSFNEQIAEKDKEITSLKDSLHTNVLKNGVIRELSGFVNDPETVFTLLKDNFELKDDGKGNLVPRVKDSVQDIKSYTDKTLTDGKKDYFLLSGRKNGTQQPAVTTNGQAGAALTVAQLNTMSAVDQKKAYAENPKLAEQVLGQMKLPT